MNLCYRYQNLPPKGTKLMRNLSPLGNLIHPTNLYSNFDFRIEMEVPILTLFPSLVLSGLDKGMLPTIGKLLLSLCKFQPNFYGERPLFVLNHNHVVVDIYTLLLGLFYLLSFLFLIIFSHFQLLKAGLLITTLPFT